MRSGAAVLWQLLRLMRPFAGQALLALLLAFLTVMSSVGLLMSSAWLISTAGLRLGMETLSVAPTAVRFFGVSRAVLRYLERLVSHSVTFKLLVKLRVWFYERLEPLPTARLQAFRSGDLIARVVGDVDELQNIYLRVFAPPLVALLVTLATVGLFALIDTAAAVTLLAFMAAGATLLPLLTWWAGQTVGRDIVQTRSALSAHLVDSVQGLADSSAYGDTPRLLAGFDALQTRLMRRERQMVRLDSAQAGFSLWWVNMAAAVVLWVAIGRVDGVLLGTLALGTLAAFEAITPLALAAQHLGKELEAARHVLDVLASAPAAGETTTGTMELPGGALSVTFERVCFRYAPDDPPVLEDFSLHVPPGGLVVVTGESGAGKSSLVNLLARFWTPDAGRVLLGDVPLAALSAEQARACLGVMTQRTYLFNTTLRENIRIARKTANDAEVEEAARRAQLHDFALSLPQGYDTFVGENGAALSGGQRQRVALARILLKDAPVWVLDEVTANLDPITANEVMRAVLAQAEGRTVLLLTHRLSPVEREALARRGQLVRLQGLHVPAG